MSRYDYRGLGQAARVAYAQALAIGCDEKDARLLADSVKTQKAILRFMEDHPDDKRALVDLTYQREFARLLATQEDEVWYCRAAAGVKAAEVAIVIDHEINWILAIKNAAIVAEANCDGTDEEAEAAAEEARAIWRAKFEACG